MSGQAIRTLVSEIDAYLAGLTGPGIADVRKGIEAALPGEFHALKPLTSSTVERHLPECLSLMRADGHASLADAIEAARPQLHWVTYDAYPRAEIGAFADRHGFASLIGEASPLAAVDYDLGLFLIAPEVLYRDHHHAAPELYAPLTGPHGWRFAVKAKFEEKPAHVPVWNEPWQVHATLTGKRPFLCIFAWTRDVSQPAKICY